MKKILIATIFVGLVITGCKEKFLELYPTTQISDNAAFKTPENAMAVLYGIYDNLTEDRLLGAWVTITNEVRADDAFVPVELNWNFWVESFNYTWLASSTRRGSPSIFWQLFYSVIENCNAAINAELPFAGEEKDAYLGEVKVMRALSYFNLVQMFCMPYTYDSGDSPGIPLYTISDVSQMKGRGKVSEVYELIEQDIADAIAGLPLLGGDAGAGATRFTKCFANGLAARVKMAKGEYSAALPYIEDALEDAPTLNTDIADYIRGTYHKGKESIYNIPFNTDDYGIYWGLSSFYDHPEGYGDVFMTSEILSKYSADDVRKNWFITPLFYNLNDPEVNTYFADYLSELYHFEGYLQDSFDEVTYMTDNSTVLNDDLFYPNNENSWSFIRRGHHSIYGKFPRLDAAPGSDPGSVGLGQPSLMRTSELLLMKAECEARTGTGTPAETLYLVQHRASASAVLSTNTGAALIDEIILERRKELVGEGFRFLDILRLGLPLNRPNIVGPNWSAVMSLSPYDPKMIFPIPESELDSNDMLNNEDQNPGYN